MRAYRYSMMSLILLIAGCQMMDYSHLALTALAPQSSQASDTDIIATVGPTKMSATKPSATHKPNNTFSSVTATETLTIQSSLTPTPLGTEHPTLTPSFSATEGVRETDTPFHLSPTPTGTFTVTPTYTSTPTRIPPSPSWTPFHLTATETASFTPTMTYTFTPEPPTWTAIPVLSAALTPTQPPSGLPPKGY
jgi:hypothetical protein